MANNLTSLVNKFPAIPSVTEEYLESKTNIQRRDVLNLVREKEKIKRNLIKVNKENNQVKVERDLYGITLRKKCGSTTEFMNAVADTATEVFGVNESQKKSMKAKFLQSEKNLERANTYSDIVKGVYDKKALPHKLKEVEF